MAKPDQGPIAKIGGEGRKPDEIRTPVEEQGSVKVPSLPEEGAEIGRLGGLSPNLRLNLAIQPALRHLGGSAMQAFRLPASNRVVHDNRENVSRRGADERAGRKDDAHDKEEGAKVSRREKVIKEGKIEEAREKKYENYLGARERVFAKEDGMPLPERPLSEFEELLIKRFEEGKSLEEVVTEGKLKFGEKTVEEWKAFFQKFLDRTAQKQIELSDIEKFLFRGLVKKSDAKAVVISDIVHNSGKTEKFVRFGVLYQKLSGLLSKLLPGDAVAKQAFADGISGEKLLYLALNPPSQEAEMFTGLKPSQGMFGLEATEARVADELGIARDKGAPQTGGQNITAKMKKKRGGLFRWLVGDEDVPLDESGQFIPWWQWGTLKKPGGLGLKRAFYSGVIIIFILTVLFLINQYLLGK